MGLLDMFGTSMDDPRTAATLQLAQGLLSSPRVMQGLAGGLSGYQQAMAQAKQAKAVEEMRQMQLQQMQMQMAAQRQQQEQAQLDREGMRQLSMPIAGTEANKASGLMGPTPQAAAVIGKVPPLDTASMLAKGMSPQAIEQMFAVRNLGVKPAPQLDRVEVAKDPATGQLVNVMLFKDGSHKVLPYGVKPEMVMQDLGNKVVAVDKNALPSGSALTKGMTPDGAASNAVAWANVGLGRDRLALDRETAGGVTYQTDGTGQIVALPKRPNLAGNITAVPVQGQGSQGRKDANDALALIEQAQKLIPNATNSYLGNAVDYGLNAFGWSTEGGQNASKLKALEGALVSKMPKMSGPQSDKDVAMYRQMAAEIGNPNVSSSRRLAALEVVKEIQMRYANQGAQPFGQPAPTQPAGSAPVLRWNAQTMSFD